MDMEKLAGEIGNMLTKLGLTITTAESCTGGGLSYWLTQIPGSSNWFERGFVTYSNAAKMEMLGVQAQTLERFGAVSEETAREMAAGALAHSQADVSVAITGIAGPDGGSADKPVGTVWIAWQWTDHLHAQAYLFTGSREEIRVQTINAALHYLHSMLPK